MSKKVKSVGGSAVEQTNTHKNAPHPSFDLDDIIKELPVAPMFGGGRRSTSESVDGTSAGSTQVQGYSSGLSQGLASSTNGNTSNPTHRITTEELAKDPNYSEISKSELSNLPKGTYLRYVDINNVVKPGGNLNAITTSLDGEVLLKFGKYNVGLRKYFAWSVRTSQISKLYKYNASLEKKKVPVQIRSDKYTGTKSGAGNGQGLVGNGSASATHGAGNGQELAAQGLAGNVQGLVDSTPPHTSNPEDQFLNQLGGKILLDNGVDELKTRVSAIETAIEKLDSDLKKLFILVKRIYKQ
jgi:hypothetical protein